MNGNQNRFLSVTYFCQEHRKPLCKYRSTDILVLYALDRYGSKIGSRGCVGANIEGGRGGGTITPKIVLVGNIESILVDKKNPDRSRGVGVWGVIGPQALHLAVNMSQNPLSDFLQLHKEANFLVLFSDIIGI